jgi:hypothetical protein
MFENVQRGMYSVGGREMYFRSRWEYVYAEYLELLKANGEIAGWKFEPRFFDFPIAHGTTRYLPDFEVTELDGKVWYAEVKGYFDKKSKTKLRRMAKYYPDVKVLLVQRDFIKSVEWISKRKLSGK